MNAAINGRPFTRQCARSGYERYSWRCSRVGRGLVEGQFRPRSGARDVGRDFIPKFGRGRGRFSGSGPAPREFLRRAGRFQGGYAKPRHTGHGWVGVAWLIAQTDLRRVPTCSARSGFMWSGPSPSRSTKNLCGNRQFTIRCDTASTFSRSRRSTAWHGTVPRTIAAVLVEGLMGRGTAALAINGRGSRPGAAAESSPIPGVTSFIGQGGRIAATGCAGRVRTGARQDDAIGGELPRWCQKRKLPPKIPSTYFRMR